MHGRAWRWLPFVLLIGVYALELRVDLMDVDAAQYAHISQEMFATKSFLVVKNHGADYLDKPPLCFWLASLSFAIFGVSTVAYKLPSLLFALLALYSTYRFARLYYEERLAYTAALMLGSSVALFLWTNDVRTDTVLLGAVTFTVWQLAAFRKAGGWGHFVAGFIGMGVALLAKGPIGAAVPVLALAGDATLKRDWRWLFSPRWLLSALIVLVVLSPMLWGLHEQFGVRGLRFFFWTQSFGRITGESSWKDSTTPLFFTHTILWELLPWTALFLMGFASEIRALVTAKLRLPPEADGATFCGFLLPFAALTLSHYKLPHYILVVLPFACILAAKQVERGFRATWAVQSFVVAFVWIAAALITLGAFPMSNPVLWTTMAIGLLVTIRYSLPDVNPWERIMTPSFVSITVFALMLAVHFYPTLLRYQSPTEVARYIAANGIPAERVGAYRIDPYSLDFALQRSVPRYSSPSEVSGGWLLTTEGGRAELAAAGRRFDDVARFGHFPITRLSLPFLRPSLRETRLEHYFLLRAVDKDR